MIRIYRKICCLLLVMMILLATPMTALAATSATVLDGDITVSADNTTVETVDGGVKITFSASGFQIAKEFTFTVKNTSGVKATVNFDFAFASFGDSTSLGKESGTYGATVLAPDATITFTATIKCVSGQTSYLTLNNFSLTPIPDYHVTINYDSNCGSVTAAGAAATNGQTVTAANGTLALAASPKSGCMFLGWVNTSTGVIVSKEVAPTLTVSENTGITAVFASSDTAWFLVDDKYLVNDLTKASEKGTKIVLMNNGTLSGSHTIAAGDTLLIPRDAANTVYTTKPACDGNGTYTKPTVYRQLTMAANASITVNGAISVAGMHQTSQTYGYNGVTNGPTGYIKMLEGSTITINSGAKLYAWGYIYGSGSVTVESGGTVYESFQVRDYRGGDATTTIKGKEDTWRLFPMMQYYVQNVEVPMTLKAGAIENAVFSVYVTLGGIQQAEIPFVGESNCMFNITNGYVVKDYIEESDRLYITVCGDMSMQAFEFAIKIANFGSSVNFASEKYILPLNHNISIDLGIGSNFSVGQDIGLLPGAEIMVQEGAKLDLNAKLYLYDNLDWGKYCGEKYASTDSDTTLKPLDYVAHSPQYARWTEDLTQLAPASVRINGELDATNGNVYTSSHGAKLYSTGKGKLILGTAGATHNAYQVDQNSTEVTPVEIPFTAAQLEHGDGTYLQSAAGTYYYDHGKWILGEHTFTDKVVAPTCTEVGYTTHSCVCGYSYNDTEVAALGHTEATREENRAEATCGTAGSYDLVTYCSVCTTVIKTEPQAIPATGAHADAENDGNHTCDTCGTADISNHTWSDATCTAPKTCSECRATDGEALSHKYGEVSYAWGENNATCTAKRVCENDASHVETVDATVSSETTDATCTVPGKTVYTATFTESWAETQTAEVGIPAKNHSWGTASYEWSEDKSTCTAKRICGNDETHVETADATVYYVTTDATCTVAGKTVYTASFAVDWASQQTDEVELPVVDHTPAEAVKEKEVEPDYNNSGSYDSVVYCSICKTYEISRETITVPALQGVASVNSTNYGTLADAVAAAGGDDTVTLLADATGAGVVIDKSITIDFGGNTYTVNKAVGSAGTETLGFQILADNTVTLKNGTLTSAAVVDGGKEVKVLIQNYSDLTMTDMNLVDATEHIQYVLSNNSGEIAVTGATNITTDAVAFDVYDYSSAGYAVPSMTVNTTGTITGKIEVSEAATLAISGGTFTVPIKEAWCAEGYGPNTTADENGYYGVHEHIKGDAVKENEKDATCGADGSYDSVVKCSVCGNELSRETVTVPATGEHVYATETERRDATCTEDGYVVMACGCGAKETTTLDATGHTAGEAVKENEAENSYESVVYCTVCDTELSRETITVNSEPVLEESLKFNGHNLELASELSIQWGINYATVQNATDFYVVFTKTEGFVEETRVMEYRVNKEDMLDKADKAKYYAKFPYVSACDMGVEISAVLYVVDADGTIRYSNPDVYSVRHYANALINKYQGSATVSNPSTDAYQAMQLAVELLNYGTAAQEAYTYKTDDKVNAHLTDAQTAFAVQKCSYTNVRDWGAGNTSSEVVFKSSNLQLQSKISSGIRVDISNLKATTLEGLTAVVTNAETGDVIEEITGNNFRFNSGKQYYVDVVGIKAINMRMVVNIAIYANYGEADQTQVSSTATYSVESYTALANDANSDFAAVSLALLKYGDAAVKYFA